MHELGPILYRARQAKNLSLPQLAEVSGVSVATIFRIECGKTDPRFRTQLVPLLIALGLDIKDLFRKPQPKKGKP